MLWQFAIVDKQGAAPRDLDKAKAPIFQILSEPTIYLTCVADTFRSCLEARVEDPIDERTAPSIVYNRYRSGTIMFGPSTPLPNAGAPPKARPLLLAPAGGVPN